MHLPSRILFPAHWLLILDWLVAIAWLLRVVCWQAGLRRIPDLAKNGADALSARGIQLSVIVAARNEAENIAVTLRSLLDSSGVGSGGVDLEILAVDDRSSDETGAIMDKVAAMHAAESAGVPAAVLRVLHITALPAGWLGKTHAMAVAAREARGEWLLFTDGDVVFAPQALCRGLGLAITSAADHFVLLPTVLLESWGEKAMISFLDVVAIWGPRPWRVADPRARRDAIGVGAFNLLRREAYKAIGGWEALRMEVVEDLALGRRIKKRGLRQRVALGRGLISVRWAEGISGVAENLAKNLFAVFRFRIGFLLGFMLLSAIFTLYPLAMLATGAAARWAAGLMLIAVFAAYRGQSKYQPFSVWQMIWFPAASAWMLYLLLRSMLVVLLRGGVTWRGTFYPLRELRQYQQEN